MNIDDIIRMAREAGLQEYLMRVYRAEEGVHHFAALVAAAEREACAQILDRNVAVCGNNTPMRDVLAGNAMAIRARGKHD